MRGSKSRVGTVLEEIQQGAACEGHALIAGSCTCKYVLTVLLIAVQIDYV